MLNQTTDEEARYDRRIANACQHKESAPIEWVSVPQQANRQHYKPHDRHEPVAFEPEVKGHQGDDIADENHCGPLGGIGDVLPRIAKNNVLTAAYAANIETRPAGWEFGCNPDGSNLALLWMAPPELTATGPISNEAIGALVAAVDAGGGIIIHAATAELAQRLGEMVLLFAGGGHA